MRAPVLLLRCLLLAGLGVAASPASAFTFTVNYGLYNCANPPAGQVQCGDLDGKGFLDHTAAANPVGGNTGTTLGDQRKQAFEFALSKWAARLGSNINVVVQADWTDQFCSPSGAALGNAGPTLVLPSGLPHANTWYPEALANALKGSDTNPSGSDITAHFNLGIDTKPGGGCLGTTKYYYGLDQNPGTDIDFLNVAMHELGHGLGFTSLVNASTGAPKFSDGRFTALDFSLFDESTSLALPFENDSQRAAVAVSGSNLTFNSANTNAGNSFVNAASKTNGHQRMFAPNPAQSGSSISHWDSSAVPDLVMEPSYGVIKAAEHVDLTTCAFADLGWTLIGGFACPDLANPAVDLSMTANDGTDPVTAGKNLTYTLILHNNSGTAAPTVSVSDPLPAAVKFVSVITPAGWGSTLPAVGTTGTVTFTNPSVAAGSTTVFKVNVSTKSDLAPGTVISNTATASSPSPDPVPANNSGTATTTTNAAADLFVTNADSPDPVLAGATIKYSINASNVGPSVAASVTVSDQLSPDTTFVSAVTPAGWTLSSAPAVGASGTVTFTKSSLATGTPTPFKVFAKVIPNVADSTVIQNTASVSSATSDPNSANNSALASTTSHRQADLSLTVTDSPDPVHVGAKITYSVKLINNGPSNADSLTLTDTLPASTTFFSATPPAGWNCITPAVGASGTVTCTAATMSPTPLSAFIIVAKVNAATANGTVLSNTPSVSASTTDPTPANNSATASTTVANP